MHFTHLFATICYLDSPLASTNQFFVCLFFPVCGRLNQARFRIPLYNLAVGLRQLLLRAVRRPSTASHMSSMTGAGGHITNSSASAAPAWRPSGRSAATGEGLAHAWAAEGEVAQQETARATANASLSDRQGRRPGLRVQHDQTENLQDIQK